MYFKVGTLADWFDVGIIEGIKESQKCGAQGVQLYATESFDPRYASRELIEEVKKTLKECNQEVAALCCDLGGYGFEKAEDNPEKIEYLKKCADLAKELDCNVLTTHLGVVPASKDVPRYQVMLDACKEIAAYAYPMGIYLAIETGPESGATLRAFIDDCGDGVGVNFDPANFVMVGADDELNAVKILGDKIVHTHASDGRNLKPIVPEDFYHQFAEGGLEWMATANICVDLPLGEGVVRWPEYLTLLKEVGFKGFLTIEHEVHGRSEEIKEAVEFLNKQMEELKL